MFCWYLLCLNMTTTTSMLPPVPATVGEAAKTCAEHSAGVLPEIVSWWEAHGDSIPRLCGLADGDRRCVELCGEQSIAGLVTCCNVARVNPS